METCRTGIDVLEAHNFDVLQGQRPKKRVGLVTNQTGVDSQGGGTIDVLAHAPGVKLAGHLQPEHGMAGTTGHDSNRRLSRMRRPGFPSTASTGDGCGAGPRRWR